MKFVGGTDEGAVVIAFHYVSFYNIYTILNYENILVLIKIIKKHNQKCISTMSLKCQLLLFYITNCMLLLIIIYAKYQTQREKKHFSIFNSGKILVRMEQELVKNSLLLFMRDYRSTNMSGIQIKQGKKPY